MAVRPRPTGAKSYMPNDWPTTSWRTWATMMFGAVPTSVTIPPAMAPKAIGISSREGAEPVRRATCRATGIMIASAPTFLVAMDSRVTTPVSTGT
ncbi:hypothetical protein D3C71_1900270 [compost metagenome]